MAFSPAPGRGPMLAFAHTGPRQALLPTHRFVTCKGGASPLNDDYHLPPFSFLLGGAGLLASGKSFRRRRTHVTSMARSCLPDEELPNSDLDQDIRDRELYEIGKRVECRDREGEWKRGNVVSFAPLKVLPDDYDEAFAWDEVRPLQEDEDAQDSALYQVGQRVECRDSGAEWKKGQVASLGPLKVQPDDYDEPFTWAEVRPLQEDEDAQDSSLYQVGQRVECRDSGAEWKLGQVVSLGPLKVQPDDYDEAFAWAEVRPLQHDTDAEARALYQIGQRVECRDSAEGEWKQGEVVSFGPLKVLPDDYDEAFSWAEVRPL